MKGDSINRKIYIATWFYRENTTDCSYYPQVGGRGDSPLLHSVYMQILIPFFETFRHYNPQTELLFFTNIHRDELPKFLHSSLERCKVRCINLPYKLRPPKDWYHSWANQFYLYDILHHMGGKIMNKEDILLVCDADCICHKSLKELFVQVSRDGSALYDVGYEKKQIVNGASTEDLERFYEAMYGVKPRYGMRYYGGEFVCFRGDIVQKINYELPSLYTFNFGTDLKDVPRLYEEAHILSVLVERIQARHETGGKYVKRMWTGRIYSNVAEGDSEYSVWHLPAEKKTGLYLLYRFINHHGGIINEEHFWHKASLWCGLRGCRFQKQMIDVFIKVFRMRLLRKFLNN